MRTLPFIYSAFFTAISLAIFSRAAAQAEPAPSANFIETQKEQEEEKKDELKVYAELGRGITVDGGEAVSLNLGARVTLRYELEPRPEPEANTSELAHRLSVPNLRFGLGGHLIRRSLTYRLQLNLSTLIHQGGQGNKESPLYDAYFNYASRDDLSIRVGQFFVPFNKLRTISDWALQLGARSIAVREFSLHRDLGVRFGADRLFGERSPIALQLGLFGGDGTNDYLWRKPGALVVSRLEIRPFGAFDDELDGDLKRREEPALAIGAAFAANLNASKHQSNSGQRLSEGTRHFLHASADLIFKWRGFAFQSEVILRRATPPTSSAAAERTRDGYGATAQLSYALPSPLEFVGRIFTIEAFSDADPDFVASVERGGRELGVGVNYYLRGHYLKVQSDYAVTTPRGFAFERASHIARVQLDASF